MDIYSLIASLKSKGEDAYLVTVTDKSGMAPSDVGKKMVVLANGESFGTIGGGAIEHYAIEKCKSSFLDRTSFSEKYLLMDKDVQVDNDEVKLEMACGGRATLFYEFIGPKQHVFVFGAGHCGKALCALLKPINFHVTVIDNRQELLDEIKNNADEVECIEFDKFVTNNAAKLNNSYIVVATPSHKYDYDVLNKIFTLHIKPAYFGMLCSKKKISDYLAKIYDQYGKEIDLSNFYSPIGLNLGGDSPEEIAVSITSEILSIYYKKDKLMHMRDKINNGDKSCD